MRISSEIIKCFPGEGRHTSSDHKMKVPGSSRRHWFRDFVDYILNMNQGPDRAAMLRSKINNGNLIKLILRS